MDIVPVIFVFVVVSGMVAYVRWGSVVSTDATLTYFDCRQIVLRLKTGLDRRISWKDVIAIFTSFSQKPMKCWVNFAFELSNGECVGFLIEQVGPCSESKECGSFQKLIQFLGYNVSERRRLAHVEDTLERLYDCFAKNLSEKEINMETFAFSHPTAWIKSKHRSLRATYALYGFSFLFMTVEGRNLSGWGPFLFSGLFAILAFAGIGITWFLARHQKCLISLSVQGNQLIWRDERGQSNMENIMELRSYCFHKTMSFMKFSDGTTLRALEKLRYWPLLREFLIQKLESVHEQLLVTSSAFSKGSRGMN